MQGMGCKQFCQSIFISQLGVDIRRDSFFDGELLSKSAHPNQGAIAIIL
jgi:hypothetical protein